MVDTVQVELDEQTVAEDHLLHVRLCQDAGCSEVEAPANQYVIQLPTAELRPAPDPDEPGRITARVTDAAGRVVGETTVDLALEEYSDRCGSARRQEISVEAGTG